MPPITASRVLEIVKAGRQAFRSHRDVYRTAQREVGGPWHGQCPRAFDRWSNMDGNPRQPVSLLDQLVTTYLPNICGPRVKPVSTTERASLRSEGELRQNRLRLHATQARLARVHAEGVEDALLGGVSAFRVCCNSDANQLQAGGAKGAQIAPGALFVRSYPITRLLFDPRARSYDSLQWYGVWYEVEKQFALDLNVCDNDVLKGLDALEALKDEEPDVGVNNVKVSDLFDRVRLIDLWVFDGRQCWEMTLPWFGQREDWVIEPREYNGPKAAPLEFLSMLRVGEQLMPKSPIMSILDLHLGLAEAAKKIVAQTIKTGRRYLYKPDHEDTAITVRDGVDDEWVKSEDPEFAKEMQVGGMLADLAAAMGVLRDEANNMSASLQMTGGKSGSGNPKTATGMSIIASNAQTVLGGIRENSDTTLGLVVGQMAWYLDQVPTTQIVPYQLGNGESAEMIYDPANLQGTWEDFNYSAEIETTESIEPNLKRVRAAECMNVAMPVLDWLMMRGGNIDAATRMFARVWNLPELTEILPSQTAMMADMAMNAMAPRPQGAIGQRTTANGVASPPGGQMGAPRTALAPAMPQPQQDRIALAPM